MEEDIFRCAIHEARVNKILGLKERKKTFYDEVFDNKETYESGELSGTVYENDWRAPEIQIILQKMGQENKEMQTAAQWSEIKLEMYQRGYSKYVPHMDLEQQTWERLGKDLYNQPKGKKGKGKGTKGAACRVFQ